MLLDVAFNRLARSVAASPHAADEPLFDALRSLWPTLAASAHGVLLAGAALRYVVYIIDHQRSRPRRGERGEGA